MPDQPGTKAAVGAIIGIPSQLAVPNPKCQALTRPYMLLLKHRYILAATVTKTLLQAQHTLKHPRSAPKAQKPCLFFDSSVVSLLGDHSLRSLTARTSGSGFPGRAHQSLELRLTIAYNYNCTCRPFYQQVRPRSEAHMQALNPKPKKSEV